MKKRINFNFRGMFQIIRDQFSDSISEAEMEKILEFQQHNMKHDNDLINDENIKAGKQTQTKKKVAL
ncbi:hypothetical protein KA005_50255, partial [bacterium]|nr:hypothetical protein [bacterium]